MSLDLKVTRALRVGVDLHVVDGIFQGSRTHVLELFSEVARISPDINFVFFLEKTELLREFSMAFIASNIEVVCMRRTNPVMRLCWQLPALQKKHRLDVLHSQYISPLFGSAKKVVTIHDILFESHPKYFNFLFRLRSKILMRLSAKWAAHVFTVSSYSKKEISSHYKIPFDKISVIANGVDKNRFFPGDSGREIVESRGLVPKDYLLSVGRLEPRKNYVTLLKAYGELSAAKLPLVIIGQPDFKFDELFETIKKLSLESKVIILNDVKDNELPAFYRNARLFVYPTWAEGFGMPILEAMASGLPIISSNTTAIPEIVGSSGILIEPENTQLLSESIGRVLSDDGLYLSLQAAGFSRIEQFCWKKSAEIVRDVYKAINANKGAFFDQ